MTKFFTTLAAAAFAATAMAAPSFYYTVDPAEGEVDILQFITVTFPDLDEIEFNQRDDIKILRSNGSEVRGVTVSIANDNQLKFVLGAEQTDRDTYTVNIPAGSLGGYGNNYAWMQDNPDIKLTYVIAGGAAEGFDWSYNINPAPGEVTQIDEISIQFPKMVEMDINSFSGATLTYNGKPVEKAGFGQDGPNSFFVEPQEPLTAPGTYKLTMEEGMIAAYSADYSVTEDLPQTLEFTWTIGGEVSGLDFAHTSSLPGDGFLAYFGDVTLTFDKLDKVEYSGKGVDVLFNGTPLADVTVATDANKLTVTLKDALNFVEGTVEVAIEPEALTGTAAGESAANMETITATYHMAQPVEYNLALEMSNPKPNADGQISAEKSLESIFFVCQEKGLVAAPGGKTNVTIKQAEGDFEATGSLRKANGLNANYTYFSVAFGKEPTYNGIYTITIDRGAFGTEAWATDPNYGKSNAEIQLNFELVDGLTVGVALTEAEAADEAVYNLQGTRLATPASELPKGIYIIGGKKVVK